jgi:arylsulfatase A-like enzyme
MPRTQKALVEKGALGTNFFIFTPVCCPSRAETLTGRMFHRLRINGVNGTRPGEKPPHITPGKNGGGCIDGRYNGCMCVNITLVNQDSFPMYLKAAGYTVGLFGKQLNSCVKDMPAGYDRWYINPRTSILKIL